MEYIEVKRDFKKEEKTEKEKTKREPNKNKPEENCQSSKCIRKNIQIQFLIGKLQRKPTLLLTATPVSINSS